MGRTYLLEEPPVMVYPRLAAAAGVNAAAILQKIYFFQTNDRSGMDRDGRRWVFNTTEAWVRECFPWISQSQFRAIRDELKRAGLILTRDDLSKETAKGTNQSNRLWYSVDAELLIEAMAEWEALGSKKGSLCHQLQSRAENQQDFSHAENQHDLAESHAENQQDFGGGKGGVYSENTLIDERTDDPDALKNKKAEQISFNGKTIDGISHELRQAWITAFPLVDVDNAIKRTEAWLILKQKPAGTDVGDLLAHWLDDANARARQGKPAKTSEPVSLAKDVKQQAEIEAAARDLPVLNEAERAAAIESWKLRRMGDEPGTPPGIASTQSWRWSTRMNFPEYVRTVLQRSLPATRSA